MPESPVDFQADFPRSGLAGEQLGIGGVLKDQPEDFRVEEIPAYHPSGEGEHLFLWLEKCDLSGEQLTRYLARSLDISNRDIGIAGIKDRRAICRQYVSVPAPCENRLAAISDDRIRILNACRHQNKLRRGHLRGNRFSILVRQTRPGVMQFARDLGAAVQARGFPNYFGEQRFGADQETLRTGWQLLTGQTAPRDLPRSRKRFLLSLSLSAVQSYLFNLALAHRVRQRDLFRVMSGDVMQVVETGGKFVVEDPSREQVRFDDGEIVTTGPMFGPKMTTPRGEPAEREATLLQQLDLGPEHFQRFPKLTLGTRRPCLVRPKEWSVHEEADGIRFQFFLPSGTYATSLLREFM
jgi:tRNA pseudouridine13 synthase